MDWASELVATHHVAECKENAAKQDDSEEKPYQVTALEHSIAACTSALSSSCHKLLFFRCRLHPLRNDIHWQREHDRRVFLDADFG